MKSNSTTYYPLELKTITSDKWNRVMRCLLDLNIQCTFILLTCRWVGGSHLHVAVQISPFFIPFVFFVFVLLYVSAVQRYHKILNNSVLCKHSISQPQAICYSFLSKIVPLSLLGRVPLYCPCLLKMANILLLHYFTNILFM